MALHEQCVGATDEWYTPPHVFTALGCEFDLDVASPGLDVTPWIPAKECLIAQDDGLAWQWRGFVWMNPPFGGRGAIEPWLDKFFGHGSGIALTPDRTSAPWWQRQSQRADAILFVAPKLKFIGADGQPGNSPAQGTTLFAAGIRAVEALTRAASGGLGVLAVPTVPRRTHQLVPQHRNTNPSHDPSGVISEPKGDSEMPGRRPRDTTQEKT